MMIILLILTGISNLLSDYFVEVFVYYVLVYLVDILSIL